MPEIASARFVQLFTKALESGGRLDKSEVQALESARRSIRGDVEGKAADNLLTFLKHDRELDAFEVTPVKKALQVLTGTHGRLPRDLEKVLAHAVPAANAKVKEYELTFDFSKDTPAFPAKAVITLDRKAGKQTILEVDPERLDIKSVKVGGKAVPFELEDGRLSLTSPGAKTLEIAYTVKPQEVTPQTASSAYGLIRDKYSGRMWSLTWPYNTGALFPSNSNPADGSTARVTVKVAAGTTAVATGNAEGNSFVAKAQAPAYGIAVYAANDFQLGNANHSRDGVEVTGYGLGDSVPKHIRDAYRDTATRALDFYGQWLGKYDYGDSLKLVEVTGGLGGMEHTAAVAIMMNAARDPEYSKETAAHETAHHWFGDNVRIKDWGDFWMSEGFTNYATYRYFRAEEGEGKFHDLLDRAKGAVRDTLNDNPHALSAPSITDVHEIFDDIPYEMGPWMLRMVEAKVGTPVFDEVLKGWFQTHRQKEVSTKEFVAFVKDKTGQDFTAFFKEWNAITQVPKFDGEVKVSGSKATISMTPKGPMPPGIEVPVRLEGTNGQSKTVTLKAGETTTVDAGFEVKRWAFDPERTVLADVR